MPDFMKIVKELELERDQLNHAIEAIRALAANKPRRGRPPKWMAGIQKEKSEKATQKRKAKPRKRVRPEAKTMAAVAAVAGD